MQAIMTGQVKKIKIDNIPTEDSPNAVSSGGVYDAIEDVSEAATTATSLVYQVTLPSTDWITSGDIASLSITLTTIRCGVNGDVPPIITWTGNRNSFEGYNRITEAIATLGVGIIFLVPSNDIPEDTISLIVTDIG